MNTKFVLTQISSLFLEVPSPAYIFFSAVEIAALTHYLECMEVVKSREAKEK